MKRNLPPSSLPPVRARSPRERPQPAVLVAQTQIGRGVLANRDFPAGANVGAIRGRVIADPDYGSDYAIDIGAGLSLEPVAPFRFLNHSCEPNCGLVVYEEEDDDGVIHGREVVLEALRPIAIGEELTIDYAWGADSAIPCGCGAPNCRRWVICEEELADFLKSTDAAPA
ncbi:MAG: SET domain-containing protein [Planctomycetota bacterium]